MGRHPSELWSSFSLLRIGTIFVVFNIDGYCPVEITKFVIFSNSGSSSFLADLIDRIEMSSSDVDAVAFILLMVCLRSDIAIFLKLNVRSSRPRCFL